MAEQVRTMTNTIQRPINGTPKHRCRDREIILPSRSPMERFMPLAALLLMSTRMVDGKAHVIGGRGLDGTVVATHEVFDPQSRSWAEAAPLPTARDHMVVIAVDGKIHVIGGRLGSSSQRTDQHDVYDPATDKWTAGAPLTTPRSGLAGAYYRGLILVLGGELPPDHTFPENEAFDPKTNRWTTLAPMPHGRHGFGGDVIADNAYFVGGSLTPGDRGATDQLVMFHLP